MMHNLPPLHVKKKKPVIISLREFPDTNISGKDETTFGKSVFSLLLNPFQGALSV